jgi:hypothetical protein
VGLVALAMKSGLSGATLDQLALPQPSIAALLIDLAEQAIALRPPGRWSRYLLRITRLLP